MAKDKPVERGEVLGSFPGRKLAGKAGCFSRNEIAIGPCENAFPGSAVAQALDGPEGALISQLMPAYYVISRH